MGRWPGRVYIDAKISDIQTLIDVVHRLSLADQVFFWFGSDKKERLLRQLAPDIDLKTNAYNTEAIFKADKNYCADIVETELNWIIPELVEACRQTGIKLMLFVGVVAEPTVAGLALRSPLRRCFCSTAIVLTAVCGRTPDAVRACVIHSGVSSSMPLGMEVVILLELLVLYGPSSNLDSDRAYSMKTHAPLRCRQSAPPAHPPR